ncbi:PREDICTED: extensin-like [Cyprinodon variegatus]|uniref:extensin-like n=1 Tax=Cyprinodon variegatus TaxID=28743 RepID=UPI000742C222|nr:PREDICTED: extensin-like [Cyprinodon variegatus]
MKDGKLVFDNDIFPWRIADRNHGIDIGPIHHKDSGTFEFRDPQGNLALSVALDVSVEPAGGLALIICVVVGLLLGICCCYCCCKKKCCKKDKPAVVLTQGPVAYHENSASAAPAPVTYYHGTNQPTGPSYSNTSYSSVYPPHPVNPPAYASPAAVSMGPSLSEPNTTVYPPQPTILSPPQPEPASQVGPLTYQESEAAPTFSLEVSDDQPRFQIKGLAFPSAPPLTADAPSTDVYISDKLNFL